MKQYLLICLGSLILAVAADDMCDHLVHHFNQGITNGLDRSSYWYPDWTRKYNEFGQRKTVFGLRTGWRPIDALLRVPAWVYDGWHLMKVIRVHLWITFVWAWGLFWAEGMRRNRMDKMEVFYNWLFFNIVIGAIVWIVHPIFYEWLYKL